MGLHLRYHSNAFLSSSQTRLDPISGHYLLLWNLNDLNLITFTSRRSIPHVQSQWSHSIREQRGGGSEGLTLRLYNTFHKEVTIVSRGPSRVTRRFYRPDPYALQVLMRKACLRSGTNIRFIDNNHSSTSFRSSNGGSSVSLRN